MVVSVLLPVDFSPEKGEKRRGLGFGFHRSLVGVSGGCRWFVEVGLKLFQLEHRGKEGEKIRRGGGEKGRRESGREGREGGRQKEGEGKGGG
uniref:Uncharacterized protein n=1 Tax=Solanum lycopersicum TaxID=4081 RepID=A0A3Q7IGF8_SOLLC